MVCSFFEFHAYCGMVKLDFVRTWPFDKVFGHWLRRVALRHSLILHHQLGLLPFNPGVFGKEALLFAHLEHDLLGPLENLLAHLLRKLGEDYIFLAFSWSEWWIVGFGCFELGSLDFLLTSDFGSHWIIHKLRSIVYIILLFGLNIRIVVLNLNLGSWCLMTAGLSKAYTLAACRVQNLIRTWGRFFFLELNYWDLKFLVLRFHNIWYLNQGVIISSY